MTRYYKQQLETEIYARAAEAQKIAHALGVSGTSLTPLIAALHQRDSALAAAYRQLEELEARDAAQCNIIAAQRRQLDELDEARRRTIIAAA